MNIKPCYFHCPSFQMFDFFWSDGTKLTFTKWDFGEPNFLLGECCVNVNWPWPGE